MGSDVFSHAPEPNAPSLQKVDYQYNIRGWLTHINNTKSLQNSEDPNDDLFAFAINYTATDQDYSGEVNPLYNGNTCTERSRSVAETLWRSGSDNVERSYGYTYDAMNRLTNAIYGKPNSSAPVSHNYNEWLSYDKNGNILTLGRNGISDSSSEIILIDNLDYHYESDHSNILIGVNDKSGNTAGFNKDYLTDFLQDVDYEYDDNGNLVADPVKNISSITYNHLNLPVKITFDGNSQKYIEYIYTATGEKLMKIVKHNDSLSNTRYIHGFQYYDNVLQFFHISTPLNAGTPEGYVKNTPDDNGTPSFDYVYQYKDHLGNVRVNYAQDPQGSGLGILDESHYYPFGLQHTNYNSDITKIDRKEELNNEKGFDDTVIPFSPFENPGYKYKFGGKELQSEFGIEMYDFGARNYDPALGRWMNIDPLAENYFDNSPYNYVLNNPIIYVDPDGMEIKDPDKVVEMYKNHLKNTTKDIQALIKNGVLNEGIGNKLISFNDSELDKISDLEKSDQVYTFSSQTTNKEGGVTYNSSTDEVIITVGKNDMGLIGHEINHGYQFEKGEISLISDNSDYGSLYDIGDETASFNVERAVNSGLAPFREWNDADVLNFGRTVMSPPAYQTLPTISINLKSKQGKDLRKRTIEAGKNGTPVKEVYIGWQKDYNKGTKKKK